MSDPLVSDLLKHLEGHPELRAHRTAVRALAEMSQPDEPSTIAWFEDNLQILGARLRTEGTADTSIASYRSRARFAIRFFLGRPYFHTRAPSSWLPTQGPITPPKLRDPVDLAGQISDALRALADWPLLHRYLLPALVQAQKDLEGM